MSAAFPRDDTVQWFVRQAMESAQTALVGLRVRFVTMRSFKTEHLFDGKLVHELDCGHIVDAWLHDDDAALPVMRRRCEQCEGRALLHEIATPEGQR